MKENNKTWPPPPSHPPVLPPPKLAGQEWSYLTHHRAGDLALGLLAGVVGHFLPLVGLLIVAEVIVPINPTPLPLWYGSWVFAVAVSVAFVVAFSRRYPALMAGYVISAVPVAAINLFWMWFGAGLAGGAAS